MMNWLRRAFSLLGPYPYNPVLIFIFLVTLRIARLIPLLIIQPAGWPRISTLFIILTLSVIPGAIAGYLTYFLMMHRKWSATNFFYYLLEIMAVQSIYFITEPVTKKFLENRYGYVYETPFDLTTSRNFILIVYVNILLLLLLALLYQAEYSLHKRIRTADILIDQLQQDRSELILAEEESRNQATRFLHDRVQSKLMILALTLKNVPTSQMTRESKSAIDEAIENIEGMRTGDLRELIQILVPDFDALGFIGSFNLLKAQYESTMDIQIHIFIDDLQLSQNLKLGLFRIAEQALLNSLIHGPANSVQISFVRDGNSIIMAISDNGPGTVKSEIKSGVGSAIIDSWTGILGGKKKILTEPGQGFNLEVKIPAKKSTLGIELKSSKKENTLYR